MLQWETAYGKAYQIQTSAGRDHWTTIYSTTTGPGGTQTLNVSGTGRYIRMYGTARDTQYGYSLWEFQVYGSGGGGTTCGTAEPRAEPARPPPPRWRTRALPAADAFDGNAGTRWSSRSPTRSGSQVDLGASHALCGVTLNWETAYATAFQIQTSTDGTTWAPIYSTTTGTGGTQNLSVAGNARYVRMNGTARATQFGYSLWEFQVFGS